MTDARYGWLEGAPRPEGPEPAVPAATVVPLRDGPAGLEILFVRRRRGGAFGGLWVFPGGRVDPADEGSAVALPTDDVAERAAEVAVARRAAVREAAEEAGLVLDPLSMVVHSWWLPPEETPRRFSTWFFLAPVTAETAVEVDRAEVHAHRWLAPSAALAARDAGDIGLAPPTWMTVWQLGRWEEAAAAVAAAAGRPPREFRTHMATAPDGRQAALWEGDAGWSDGDLVRAGPRRRLWVSPEGPWRPEVDAA
ncbi:MAG: NUDIX domain-containing protein [Acidimicrobiales bacterium]